MCRAKRRGHGSKSPTGHNKLASIHRHFEILGVKVEEAREIVGDARHFGKEAFNLGV
jgi:ribosomal protein L7/L12